MIFNKFENLEEIRNKIDVITAEKLVETANDILDENKLFSLTYI
jgi:hypothetical protein